MPNAGRVAPHSASTSGPNTASHPSSASRTRYDDSWVEISSRPSSSSLSSAAADEIVTTGLRVQSRVHGRHARRSFGGLLSRPVVTPRSRGSHSHHGRFEETESEEDQSSPSVLTGSPSSPRALSARSESGNGHNDGDNEEEEDDADDDDDGQVAIGGESEDEDDGDENATALGIAPYASVFTPQPNAFSHPPPAIQQSAPPHARPGFHAHQSRNWRSPRQSSSHTTAQRPRHSPYDIISPTYQADHDAALRASLSTLLSCAAAARGLSKPAPRVSGSRAAAGAAADLEPTTLQIVPESALLRTGPEARSNAAIRQPSPVSPALPPPPPPDVRNVSGRRTSSPDSSSRSRKGGKRKASPSRMAATAAGGVGLRSRSSSKDRATKKAKCSARNGDVDDVVPSSLLTWVLSAGVVVLVSALSFSAGYVLGREVGRVEAGGSSVLDIGGISAGGSSSGGNTGGGSCGGEAVNGLRRLRWSSSGARVTPV